MNENDKENYVSDGKQADSPQDVLNSEKTGTEQIETQNDEGFDNLPIESIGSYARVDDLLDEKDPSSSDYSPSEN